MASTSLTLTLQATDTDGICASQSPAAAGNLLINGAFASGGVATMSAAHIISITTASNDVGKSWIITGKKYNKSQTETIAGGNATTVNSTMYFSEISNIELVGGGATTAIVGITSTLGCVSDNIPIKWFKSNPKFTIQVVIPSGGTGTYTVQGTCDDTTSTTVSANWFNHATLTGKTASDIGWSEERIKYVRLLSTAMSSKITMTVLDAEE